MKLRLASSIEDRIYRTRTRPADDVDNMRLTDAYQKVRSSRLQQHVNPEQRKILRALKQSTAVLDWEGALSVLPSIPENPGPEWVPVYRSILNACCKALRLEEAKQLFWERLPQRDVMSYNMMLGLFGRLKLEQEAQELLRSMEREGVEKNGVTYICEIQVSQEASHWANALSSLSELKGKPELESSTSWQAAYLAAMTACARSGKREEVRALLGELRTGGCLDGNHWNSLIVACGRDYEAAHEVFEEMQREGFPPRLSDWKALLGTMRDLGEQRRVYEQAMESLGPRADRGELWAVLLRTAVHLEDHDGINWVLDRMREHGVDPVSDEAKATPALRRALRWARIFFARSSRRASSSETDRAPAQSMAEGWVAPPEAPLPPGWSAAVDPASGHQYYWQDADPAGTTTWNLPTQPAAARQVQAPVA